MNKQAVVDPSFINRTALIALFLLIGVAAPVVAQTSSAPMSQYTSNAQVPGSGLPQIVNTREEVRNSRITRTDQRQARTANEKDSFEAYVEKVVDKSINIFGKELFTSVPDTFAPVDAAQVNPDYIIGTGDELQIRGWGMVDIDLNVTVDRAGAIYIPRVGAVKVAGIKYRDLQDYLRKAVSRVFTNFDLTASVAQTRAVQVYVVGHAVRPGTYTLSAMSTLLNALFVSGGPNGSGTMRNIQVKRGANTVTTFDLYDMIVGGDKSRDIPLQDGDVIYIPEVGPLVALTGDVKKPAIFELKGKATVSDVVGWAGGFDSAVESKEIVVEKNVDNVFQTIGTTQGTQDALKGPLSGIPVMPTDILRIFSPAAVPVQVQIQNEYVRVAGEIKQSGVFQLRKGETLRELISRLGGPTEKGYLYGMTVRREAVRRVQQVRLDEVADRFERDIEANAANRMASVTDEKNIAAINSELGKQRTLAQRLRSVKAEGRIVLELDDGDVQVKNLPDLPLQDGDSIVIPRRPATVDVLGAVFQQNSFIYKANRNAGDYIQLAGGPTNSADVSETYVLRADGTARSGRTSGWFTGINGARINAGDTVVVPEKIERETWSQSLREWTSIFYQFGLGAAGLKVLKD